LKVLVDTSVWVDYSNGFDSPEADLLERLVMTEQDICTCGVVVAEFLQGLRSIRSVREYSRLFGDMTWLTPGEPETYLAAAALYRDLRRNGVTVRSTIDCMVVMLAAENHCLLLARDADISRILASGLSMSSSARFPAARTCCNHTSRRPRIE